MDCETRVEAVCVCTVGFFFLLSVNFSHFHILRAIGKGAFGKVRM